VDDLTKIEGLLEKALQFYENNDFSKEVEVWKEVCEIDKTNPYLRHNLALALMNNGDFEESYTEFLFLIEKYPLISRIHNNFGILLIRMGIADYHQLIPVFKNALVLSEDTGEFIRHFLNLGNSIAYGLDNGANEYFDEIEKIIPDIVKRTHAPEQIDKNTSYMKQVLECMRLIAKYRKAFSYRKWNEAQSFLDNAKSSFLSLGMDNFANGLETHVQKYFEICRDVVALLELIGSGKNITPGEILKRGSMLHDKAVSLVNIESQHTRILNIIGWFLVGLNELIKFIDDNKSPIEISFISIEVIENLSSNYFNKLGNEFTNILRFIQRKCLELKQSIDLTASDNQRKILSEKIWSKIALYCNGIFLEFYEIDAKLCKGILGWDSDPLEISIDELWKFKSLVERQLYKDIFVDNKPQENIARALLQAFLTSRSYREVPIRGGQSDILVLTKRGRFIFETKIWRGEDYFEKGLSELEEYLIGEDDGELVGSFYVVFDPTESAKSIQHIKGSYSVRSAGKYQVNVFAIQIKLPTPSKKQIAK
jgi:tetratricopeptide (TPR) repeat protein